MIKSCTVTTGVERLEASGRWLEVCTDGLNAAAVE